MPGKWISLIVIIACFQFPNQLFCQYQITGKSLMQLKNEQVKPKTYTAFFSTSLFNARIQDLPQDLSQYFVLSESAAPKVYNYDELGMFCKFEVQIEKATHFPVKIRLGEVEAVDRKEGKWQYDNWNN